MSDDQVFTLPTDNTASMDIHGRPEDAGVYRFLEEHFFVHEMDPGMLKEIRGIDPQFVPLLCKRIYSTPANTVLKKEYFVIGRYIENPTEGYKDAAVQLAHVPRGFPFNPQKIHPLRTLWAPWEKGTAEWLAGAPPAEIKIGRWLIDQLRARKKFFDVGITLETKDGKLQQKQKETIQDKLNEILNAEEERDKRLMDEARTEARLRMRDNWRQFKEAADKERWTPEPPDAAPKPFVDLKG